MAGRLTVRRTATKFSTDFIIRIFTVLTKVQCYYSVTNALIWFFRVKYIVRHVIKVCKSEVSFFVSINSSILLSTTVLNDKINQIVLKVLCTYIRM